MIDDILAGIFGEAIFDRLGDSKRAQLIARLLFGLLGVGLAAFGAVHFVMKPDLTDNVAMLASMVALFIFLGCFCLFNVALGRQWRWPGKFFVLSLISMFVTRFIWGP